MSYRGIMGYGQAADIIGEQAPVVHREGVESEFTKAGGPPRGAAAPNGGSATMLAVGAIVVLGAAYLFLSRK